MHNIYVRTYIYIYIYIHTCIRVCKQTYACINACLYVLKLGDQSSYILTFAVKAELMIMAGHKTFSEFLHEFQASCFTASLLIHTALPYSYIF